VQTNSATSQESAAASEELSSQAAMMKKMMAKFRLKRMDGGYMPTASQDPYQDSGDDEPAEADDAVYAESGAYSKY
jgi:methyl-accepting chemotaxis protein